MNDDRHPDAVDDELRRRFGAGVPVDSDPDVVLDAMQPRLQQARTRRRASFASAIAGVAAVVVALAFVLGGGGGGESVRTPPATNSPRPTTPSTPSSTAPTGGSAIPDSVPTTQPEQAAGGGTPSVPDATPPTGPPETVPTTAAIYQGWYPSDGGTITIDFGNGRISLTGVTAAPGFTSEIHDSGPTRVEVRFSNGDTEWRIRIDVANGQLQPAEITQHG